MTPVQAADRLRQYFADNGSFVVVIGPLETWKVGDIVPEFYTDILNSPERLIPGPIVLIAEATAEEFTRMFMFLNPHWDGRSYNEGHDLCLRQRLLRAVAE